MAGERIEVPGELVFTWEYAPRRAELSALYEKAKASQWDAGRDLDWETPVNQVHSVRRSAPAYAPIEGLGAPFDSWSKVEWLALNVEMQNWHLSQFLHGEQGALHCAARLVETSPWIEAKNYAASQVMDEARHVEAFARYLREKASRTYGINPHLLALLRDTLTDRRWDLLFLGMQIIVEGFALAAFGSMQATTMEPLLRNLLAAVMRDEARHFAFGMISLGDLYRGLSDRELAERGEFALEACTLMYKNLAHAEVWEVMAVPAAAGAVLTARSPQRQAFAQHLFGKVFASLHRLGLLDAGGSALRNKLRATEIGTYLREGT